MLFYVYVVGSNGEYLLFAKDLYFRGGKFSNVVLPFYSLACSSNSKMGEAKESIKKREKEVMIQYTLVNEPEQRISDAEKLLAGNLSWIFWGNSVPSESPINT
jgi:hypothetical protein